jgi:hypothetical protein
MEDTFKQHDYRKPDATVGMVKLVTVFGVRYAAAVIA